MTALDRWRELTGDTIAEPVFICFCGPVRPAGTPEDRATCKDCDWVAAGAFADHLATHHHNATKHNWTLHWGDKIV